MSNFIELLCFKAKFPTIQKIECIDNESFKHWGVVEACEAKTMKFSMGLVNLRIVYKTTAYPEIVSLYFYKS